MVEVASPNSSILSNCIKAFVVGGGISVAGQIMYGVFGSMGIAKDTYSTYTSVLFILLGVFLTGLGVYDKLGKFAGAGSIIPITGFANSVAAPAIEHKREGLILGLGSKMFVIAGPVILYGVIASILCGTIYFLSR